MKKVSTICKVLVLMLVTAVFVSCGTAKKTTKAEGDVSEPVTLSTDKEQTKDFSGNYSWLVTGMPDGDMTGSMSLKKNETGYTGEIEANGMAVNLVEITVEGNNMAGYVPVQDTEIGFAIVFEGDSFKGLLFAGEEELPFSGKKTN